ncbi:MAG TPA: hypothetical protein VI636_14825 [Candidatus Angelobacter sp.]
MAIGKTEVQHAIPHSLVVAFVSGLLNTKTENARLIPRYLPQLRQSLNQPLLKISSKDPKSMVVGYFGFMVTVQLLPVILRGCDFLVFREKAMLKTKHLQGKNSRFFKKVTASQLDRALQEIAQFSFIARPMGCGRTA